MNKKVIIGIVAIVVILVASIGLLVMVGKEDTPNNNENTNEENITKQEQGKEENVINTSINYWITTYEFPEATKEFSLNLYNGFTNVPIKLEELAKKCDYLNYYAPKEGEYKNSNIKVNKISDIKANIEDGGELKVFLNNNDGSSATITSFIIHNYSDKTMTAQECINNGWWYVFDYNDTGIQPMVFGMDMSNNPNYHRNNQGGPLLEEIVNKIGRPTHIYSFYGAPEIKEGVNMISYYITYEYPEYVIVIRVYETINTKYNSSRLHIDAFHYFTPECYKKWVREQTSLIELLK